MCESDSSIPFVTSQRGRIRNSNKGDLWLLSYFACVYIILHNRGPLTEVFCFYLVDPKEHRFFQVKGHLFGGTEVWKALDTGYNLFYVDHLCCIGHHQGINEVDVGALEEYSLWVVFKMLRSIWLTLIHTNYFTAWPKTLGFQFYGGCYSIIFTLYTVVWLYLHQYAYNILSAINETLDENKCYDTG